MGWKKCVAYISDAGVPMVKNHFNIEQQENIEISLLKTTEKSTRKHNNLPQCMLKAQFFYVHT